MGRIVEYMHPSKWANFVNLTGWWNGLTQQRLLCRQQKPPFSHLFTCEANIEYSVCDSIEQRGLKASTPYCHLALEERCEGSCFAPRWKLRRTCYTQGLSKNAQLQATVNCSCISSLHDVMLITNIYHAMSELCIEPLWCGEERNDIAQQLIMGEKDGWSL